jgi:hypothetical protein
MNKKIKLLAESAGFRFYGLHNALGESVESDSWDSVERFAEMIIKECVNVCNKQIVGSVGTYPGAHNNAILRCTDSIKKHFEIT